MSSGAPRPTTVAAVDRLRRGTTALFIGLVVVAGLSQLLTQLTIQSKARDAQLLNVSGRQRMLSQRIAKGILLRSRASALPDSAASELEESVDEWLSRHLELASAEPGTPQVQDQLMALRPLMADLVRWTTEPSPPLDRVLATERRFLDAMDGIVSTIEAEADRKLQFLGRLELALATLSVLGAAVVCFVYCRPLLDDLRQAVSNREALIHSLDRLDRQRSTALAAVDQKMFLIDREGHFRRFKAGRGADRQRTIPNINGRPQLLQAVGEVLDFTAERQRVTDLSIRGRDGLRHFEATAHPWEQTEALVVLHDSTDSRRTEGELMHLMDRENERIARDLHDGLSQSLAGSLVLVSTLRDQQRASREDFDLLHASLSTAFAECRGLISSGATALLIESGIDDGLQRLGIEIGRAFDVKVEVRSDGALAEPDETDLELFRIAQEACSNAARHSGGQRIELSYRRTPDSRSLEVVDDGSGFDPRQRGGLGIRSMRLRARLLGAELAIEPNEVRGTRVHVEVQDT